ncbi:hypothetical protein V6N13_148597 [Hibiscus sabdariffa]
MEGSGLKARLLKESWLETGVVEDGGYEEWDDSSLGLEREELGTMGAPAASVDKSTHGMLSFGAKGGGNYRVLGFVNRS